MPIESGYLALSGFLSITIIAWHFPARAEETSFSVSSINTFFFLSDHTLSINLDS